jgi:endonuclease-3
VTTRAVTPVLASAKRPFRFGTAFGRIRRYLTAHGLPSAAMFELARAGHDSLFEQLVGCLISIRTLDGVSLPAALQLLAVARTPKAMARLGVARIDRLIRASTFHGAKARDIYEIARRIDREMGGDLPADPAVLTSFRGVGPKCAHLALGIAAGQPRIAVDVHVHRVTNRWGIIDAREPVETMAALEQILPRRYWIEINELLVPFGKHVCTGRLPCCSVCPVLDMCRQVGVTRHR